MNAVPMSASSTRSDLRAPGLYVEARTSISDERAAALMTGVPVFIGFADPPRAQRARNGVSMVVLDRWDTRQFEDAVRPAPASHLAAAVHGFFANGGRRCWVMAVSPTSSSGPAHQGLLRALEPGGPLEDSTDIDLVCVPDATCALVDASALDDIQAAALAHCQTMGDRFALLDSPAPQVLDGRDPVEPLMSMASSLRSAYGALYHPWLAVDPRLGFEASIASPFQREWRGHPQMPSADDAAPTYVPPCGHIAGLIARIDAKVGPQHAPANELLDGVVDTSQRLSSAEHARLNDGGVNCLRALRRGGIEVGGARTLSGHSRWAHVSTVRVVTSFRRWLAVGLRDLVFEPQTALLRESLRIRLVSQCLAMQAAGQIVAGPSSPAFFVQCDDEVNPPHEAALGRVVAHVGLAPSVPAEFIVVRVMHDAGGITVSGLS